MEALLAIGKLIIEYAPVLIGVILPPLVDLLNKEVVDDKEKFWVTVLACLVAAGLTKGKELVMGSPDEFLGSLSVIFLESQAVYRLYFRDSYVRRKIQDALYKREALPTTEAKEETKTL